MSDLAFSKKKSGGVPVWLMGPTQIKDIGSSVSPDASAWAKTAGFKGEKGQTCLVPGVGNKLAAVLFGMGQEFVAMDVGKLASSLPAGDYRIESDVGKNHLACLGWALGAYQFTRYNKAKASMAKLVVPANVDKPALSRAVEASYLARDLINTPANDMGPEQLEAAVRKLASTHKAKISVTKGDQLLKKNFPMIHAVGQASADAPRLIDMSWGRLRAPKVTLVGKGVIFDTGGLNIKSGSSMALMKKDMGGSANVLALAQMIMDAKLKVRLRVLIPAVENAISGNAFRPGDILPSRKGLTVEIGNTDAEGRLILADALALADEEKPDLVIDMATLTGAARVALGPDLPPFYTHDDQLAGEIMAASEACHDPLWRMPLWSPYHAMMASKVADVNHITSGGFAGSVTAALFLSRFVEHAKSWVHLDIFGWVPTAKPWAPVGGEAQCIRALYEVLTKRYG